MAKKTLKTRKQAGRTRVKPSPRISTRRPPAVAGKSRRRRAPATLARSTRAAAPDTLQVTLELRDVSNRLISDPETFFTFRRVNDRRQIGDQVAMALTGTAAVFDLPAVTGEIVVCELDAKRFRFAHSPVFFRSPGPPIRKETQLLREPNEWAPRFIRWSDLPAGFANLKRVLAKSRNVTLFKDPQAIAGLLVEAAYDGMSGEAVTIAKTALLNTYYRLNSTSEPVS